MAGELPLRCLGLDAPPIAILLCCVGYGIVNRVVCKSFATTLILPPNIFAYFIRRAGTALPAHSNISDLICRNANGGEIKKPNKINVLTF